MAILTLKRIREPKRELNTAAIRRAIQLEAEAVAKDVEKDYQKTVATWDKKPKFEIVIDAGNPSRVEILVGTDDPVYGYVDNGTKPHPIFPKRAKVLRFQAGYKAKTTPDVIGSKAGGAFGPNVYRPYVQHPGTKARNFTKKIMYKWRGQFGKRLNSAIEKAMKQSGHAR